MEGYCVKCKKKQEMKSAFQTGERHLATRWGRT